MNPFTRLFTTTAAALFTFGTAQAADVLFVDSETPNPDWQELIESGGHSYTLFDTGAYNINLNNQDSIDYVNSFDVIIISGSNPVFNAIRTHGAVWNSQPTPMINLGNFLISGQFQSGSWRWTTPGNGGTVNSSVAVDVLDVDDPIWSGLTLSQDSPPTIGLFSGNAGHLTLGSNTFLPEITTVATSTGVAGRIAIAYAEPGALREDGGAQYFIAGMTGGTNNPVNFNDDGKQAFLNAIAVLAGETAPVPTFPFTITKNPDTPGTYDFEWSSQTGKLYDLLTSEDLATPVAEWPVYHDGVTLHEAIPAAGETTTLTAIPSVDPRRFFAMRESDGPPPPPLLFADFEEDNGGFTAVVDEGTAWAWGEPVSTGDGGTVNSGNEGSARCWGTDIGNPGFFTNPTVNSRLISPGIDLSEVPAAALSFAYAIDLPPSDFATVRLFDADTSEEITFGVFPLTVADSDLANAPWQASGPHPLPVGTTIRIEWILSGQGGATEDFMGWYIDDVLIEQEAP